MNQERNLQLNKMANTQQVVAIECQVYEPEFNIETNEYYDKNTVYVKNLRNQKILHCPCNGEYFKNHSTFHLHIKKPCHKLWVKNLGEKNPQNIKLTKELHDSYARNTKLDIKISFLELEYNKLKEENAKQKEESDRIIAELKEANKREIEKAVKAEKQKEILKQKAKKHMEDLKENLKKEKEQKEGLQRDNIKLQEKLYKRYNKGDGSESGSESDSDSES